MPTAALANRPCQTIMFGRRLMVMVVLGDDQGEGIEAALLLLSSKLLHRWKSRITTRMALAATAIWSVHLSICYWLSLKYRYDDIFTTQFYYLILLFLNSISHLVFFDQYTLVIHFGSNNK